MNQHSSAKPRSRLKGPILVSLLLVGILLATVVAIIVLNAMPAGQRNEFLSHFKSGVPERHLIPAGYQGWLTVEHLAGGGPPLPIEEAVKQFRYPESGLLRTSTPWGPGIRVKEYFFQPDTGPPIRAAQSGPDRQIWGGRDVTLRDVKVGPIVAKHSYVFVGTYSEYDKAGSYHQRHSSR